MRNIFFQPLAILAAALLTAGCGGCATGGRGKVAVVMSTLNNPWLVVLGETAKQSLEDMGYEVTLFDSQNSPSKETEHFNQIIASNYKAILFNPTDADGSVANVHAAKSADIPVFCMDREINVPDAAISQLLSDNQSGCMILGQHFVRTLGGKGKYVEVLGLPGDNNTWSRSRGFHSVVDKYPDLEMVAQQNANFDRHRAAEVMASLLQAHGDIDAVFCGNDAMAMGAYQAILAAGKTSQVKVFGFDGAPEVVEAIKEKKITATGMQFPKTIARTAAELADRYIRKGERSFPQRVPVAVELVTIDNAHKYGAYEKK